MFFLLQATAQLKLAFKDPAIIPALCAVMTGSQNSQVCRWHMSYTNTYHLCEDTRCVEPRALHELSLCGLSLTLTSEWIVAPPCHQIRQSAAVMLRMRVKKHWKKISPDHRERLAALCLIPPQSAISKSFVLDCWMNSHWALFVMLPLYFFLAS